MGKPLNPTELQGRRLSVVIYWPPLKEPDHGHGALIIDTQRFEVTSSDYYVSWMGAGIGKNALQQPGAAQTFHTDMLTWGGQGGNYNGNLPTRWVTLKRLDIAAMKQAWDTLRNKPNAHWKLFDKNCATGVARVLKAGGADNYATKAQNQAVWWPSDLIKYAKSMGTAVVSTS
jgi:hypothetical protein